MLSVLGLPSFNEYYCVCVYMSYSRMMCNNCPAMHLYLICTKAIVY